MVSMAVVIVDQHATVNLCKDVLQMWPYLGQQNLHVPVAALTAKTGQNRLMQEATQDGEHLILTRTHVLKQRMIDCMLLLSLTAM